MKLVDSWDFSNKLTALLKNPGFGLNPDDLSRALRILDAYITHQEQQGNPPPNRPFWEKELREAAARNETPPQPDTPPELKPAAKPKPEIPKIQRISLTEHKLCTLAREFGLRINVPQDRADKIEEAIKHPETSATTPNPKFSDRLTPLLLLLGKSGLNLKQDIEIEILPPVYYSNEPHVLITIPSWYAQIVINNQSGTSNYTTIHKDRLSAENWRELLDRPDTLTTHKKPEWGIAIVTVAKKENEKFIPEIIFKKINPLPAPDQQHLITAGPA